LTNKVTQIPVFHLPDLDAVESRLDATFNNNFAKQEAQQQ
jgi:hypothetical protein